MDYLTVKWIHILSSTVLFGTGIGSAFFLVMTTWRGTVPQVAAVARLVVLADTLFTAPTAVLQPASGWWLIQRAGLDPASRWLIWTYALYALAIAAWIVVVFIQLRLRDVATTAARTSSALPAGYRRAFAAWLALGALALLAFVAIFHLMVFKPA